MVVEARGRERRRRKKTLASISIFFSLLSKKKKKNSNNKPTPTTKLHQVADPFRRRETRPKHMWATSGSRKVAADGWGENNNADETAAAASASPPLLARHPPPPTPHPYQRSIAGYTASHVYFDRDAES